MTGQSERSMTQGWYAIWTRSRSESVVCRQLQAKHVDTFLPLVTKLSRWRDRRKQIEWPMFPGYCFARFAPSNNLPVLTCTGVVTIVSFAGIPMPVPDCEINNLRILVDKHLPFDPCPLITDGAVVEVTDGPFRGVIGRLLRKELGRATVVLSVNVLGRGVRTEVGSSEIRAVSREDYGWRGESS